MESPKASIKAQKSQDYRFDLPDDGSWLCHLREQGYVVLKSVLSPHDVDRTIDLLWTDLEGAHRGISRDRPETWRDVEWLLPRHGIVASLAQTAGPWHVRGNASVQEAFAKIWGTTDLITSMDAVLLWRSDGFHETEGLHLDQNPFSKPHLDCVQGMVPLLPVNRDTGGLRVVPRSHSAAAKKRLCEACPNLARAGDFVPMDETSVHCSGAILLECNPGDLILWDARTVHGGFVGEMSSGVGQDEEPARLTRMSVTVAMTPRSWASDRVQEQRRQGFWHGKAFNHCPHEAGTSSGTIPAKRKKGYKKFELVESQRAML